MRGPTIRRYHASCSLALCKSLLLNLKSVDGFLPAAGIALPIVVGPCHDRGKVAFANSAFICSASQASANKYPGPDHSLWLADI
jgi:hypothetical protein